LCGGPEKLALLQIPKGGKGFLRENRFLKFSPFASVLARKRVALGESEEICWNRTNYHEKYEKGGIGKKRTTRGKSQAGSATNSFLGGGGENCCLFRMQPLRGYLLKGKSEDPTYFGAKHLQSFLND